MEVSYSWLKEFIDLPESPEEVGKLLTGTGLEVEGIEKIDMIPGGLAGVVIGEVLTCIKHPEADKLSLTTVDVGQPEPLSIVCGAPNVAAGQKVVVALVGATLHPSSGDPIQLKKTKIRGAVSEGMLCAEDELGLGTSHAGILVLDTTLANGTPAAVYFNLEADYQIAIGLTPNRIDAASHFGTARDLKAVLNRPLRMPSVDTFAVNDNSKVVAVRIEDQAACPRFSGLTISGLQVGESPDWLKKRLLSIGLKPINNIVDITNFVCYDLGQPLHAYDAAKIAGDLVVVKTLPEGTPFVTLDGVERKLLATDLMVCDAEKPMCIAGVFGGLHSGVSAETTGIFLEAAYFSAASVRKTAQHHGLKTDASFRFERGTDPNMPVYALKRAALLIQEVAGGNVSSELIDIYPDPIQPFRVPVLYKHIDRLIGIAIDHTEIHRILEALDITAEETSETGFVAIVPPYRVDVTREADVIEEILRIYGLDNVPLSVNLSADSLSEFPKTDPDQWQGRVGQLLAANGFYEILTLSLTRPAYNDAIRSTLLGADVTLLNPLSDELSVMRQSLLFSSLETLVYNINRRQKDLKTFEFGKVYHKVTGEDGKSTYKERMRLSLAMTGQQHAESWLEKNQQLVYHDLASTVQRVLSLFRVKSFETQAADTTLFQYGLTYFVNKKPIVSLGLVQPKLAKLVDLKQDVFYADFDWQALLKLSSTKARYQEVPRFPEVRRDLSLVLDKQVNFEQISRLAQQTERKILRAVNVFDTYEGQNLGQDKKAYSVSFTLQDEAQTLTDTAIEKTMNRLMAAFEKELGAVIRK
ncbi:phenylalanine--tRNA ligase subunit beta [Spirosoma foliorum]|uniref:Phenylalanine--tRNA ligase beta subunit n=1 Tax=Spirosoma foliorum TaxID=2710596 RepID=A0A7G5GZ92_9BACT|nr:phenylalanine--tRNA ligase subunit beta [Spirosoma foliorum]QMW04184.1 phenylalanine--tRNA ligase subunit beta [Spirosoma foliorum]